MRSSFAEKRFFMESMDGVPQRLVQVYYKSRILLRKVYFSFIPLLHSCAILIATQQQHKTLPDF